MRFRLQSREEEKRFLSYVRAILSTGDRDSILEQIGDLEVPDPYRVRVKIVYSPESPLEVLYGAVNGKTLTLLNGSEFAFQYRCKLGRMDVRVVDVPFFLASFDTAGVSDSIAAMISVCKAEQWKAVKKMARWLYPEVAPVLLSQKELVSAVRTLKEYAKHDISVRSFSAKETLPRGSAKPRKSIREWTDEELEQVLLNVEDRRQILTSLDVEFFPVIAGVPHVRPKTACKIRSVGEIEVTGDFPLAYEAVCSKIAAIGEEKLRFFSGRGLRDHGYKPRPLAVNFQRPLLREVEAVREFVRAIVDYPHSMHAIEHGNPYAHVKIADMFDGSTFDVWAIPPYKIALVPGLVATEVAFNRLVQYVYGAFREGELQEYGGV